MTKADRQKARYFVNGKIVFPHAGRFTIDFGDFVELWRKWPNPSRPDHFLDLDDTLLVLAKRTKFDGLVGQCERGFDALCRTIVPTSSRDSLQASNAFFEKNRDFFEKSKAVNPCSGRMVNAVRIRQWAIDKLGTEQDEPADLVLSTSPFGDDPTMEERFTFFAKLSNATENWSGADARRYLRGIIRIDKHPELYAAINQKLPEGGLKRKDVSRLVANPNVDTLFVALAIMAWGRMRTNHAINFFEQRANWLDLVDDLRRAPMNRAEAYRRFAMLREERRLDGVGPAYFTKLIFFFTSLHKENERPGYIMDQWTARSANFLASETLIALVAGPNGSRRVADSNTPLSYENFCTFVEELAKRLGITPEEVEMRMFAGGSLNNEWRKRVRAMK